METEFEIVMRGEVDDSRICDCDYLSDTENEFSILQDIYGNDAEDILDLHAEDVNGEYGRSADEREWYRHPGENWRLMDRKGGGERPFLIEVDEIPEIEEI